MDKSVINAELEELRNVLKSVNVTDGSRLIPLMKEAIRNWTPVEMQGEVGTVATVGDGIARVSGLNSCLYGEILIFEGGVRGMVQDIRDNDAGVMLFGDEDSISAGSSVMRTGRTAAVPVGSGFLSRVVDALGNPMDGLGRVSASGYRKIESPAPSIIERQPVASPLMTGILAIDSMFPIGKGQRELIIGDRQTGKTAIAVDTIINQKGKNVICIYAAIGQKASTVVRIVETLKKYNAMDYTIVMASAASDSAPLQYITPYAATAMGEYFMKKGRDVLIVYDDLSKHAAAYRTISLLLERSPGREAYPGDIFYQHSRLLERSARLSDELGGGSMTALPIVETMAGDVSAYIPTNIISITDGQIFLESRLFFAGQRPAVNVGISVSRVGGDAQTKAMKKASSGMKLSLAVYREMEAFSQFSQDLDEETGRQLKYGQTLMRLLRQRQYHAYTMADEVLLLTAAMGQVMTDVPAERIESFAAGFLEYAAVHIPETVARITRHGTLSDQDRRVILEAAEAYRDSIFDRERTEDHGKS